MARRHMTENKPERPQPIDRFYRVKEVAAMLCVSERHAWSLVAEGRLKVTKFGPRTTRVSAAAVKEFVESCDERG